MTSKYHGQCERRSGEPFPRRHSNALSIHGLERLCVPRAFFRGSVSAQPFVFPRPMRVIAASYGAGPSAFSRTRPH
jgi:hypothetical protein